MCVSIKLIYILITIFITITYINETENVELTTFMGNFTFNPQISRIFSRFLHRYRKFQIIFHTANKHVEHVGAVISYFTYNNSLSHRKYLTNFLIYNHDKLSSNKSFIRPNVSKCVNFLFSNKTYLWKTLAVPDKIRYSDVVIFVTLGNGTVRETVDKRGIKFLKLAGKVLLLDVVKHHGVTIYDTCYYCGEDSMKYRFIEKTHNTKLTSKKSIFMPSTFKNLNGHELKVVFISYFPYIACKKYAFTKKITICKNVTGIEYELIKTMSKLMNFTYKIYTMPSTATFMDMIKYINAKKADLAFGGISMTIDRIPLVQFTKQYNSEEFTFLYLFSIRIPEVFQKFIEPFSAVAVWFLYLIAFFLLSFILYAALRLKTEYKPVNITLFKCIAILFRGICEQASPHIYKIYQNRLSTSLCLGLWWWTCLILGTLYRSTILSTVVNPPSLEPENMQQLMQAGYDFVGNAQFADIIKDLLLVPDPLYRETLSKIKYGKDTCDVFKKVMAGGVAMLDEMSTIQFEIRSMCPSPPHKKIKWLRIGKKAIRSTGHAWATQIGAPFRHAIDTNLNRVLSGGHFKKWTSDVTFKYKKNMIPMSRQAVYKKFRRMPMKRFLPILTIYLSGIFISLFCFAFELIYFNTLHQR